MKRRSGQLGDFQGPGTQGRKNYVRDQSQTENKGLGTGDRAIAALGFHEVSSGPKALNDKLLVPRLIR